MNSKIILCNSNLYFGGVGGSGLYPCSAVQLFNHFASDHLTKNLASFFVSGVVGFFIADKYFPFINKIVASVSGFHF